MRPAMSKWCALVLTHRTLNPKGSHMGERRERTLNPKGSHMGERDKSHALALRHVTCMRL